MSRTVGDEIFEIVDYSKEPLYFFDRQIESTNFFNFFARCAPGWYVALTIFILRNSMSNDLTVLFFFDSITPYFFASSSNPWSRSLWSFLVYENRRMSSMYTRALWRMGSLWLSEIKMVQLWSRMVEQSIDAGRWKWRKLSCTCLVDQRLVARIPIWGWSWRTIRLFS